jgi:hypothetical protein
MTTRTYAAWVEPIAKEYREARAEFLRTGRQLLPEHWSMPCPPGGWTYKDLLAHVAGNTERLLHDLTSDIIERRPIDLAAAAAETDARNARDVEARRETPADELLQELEDEGEAWQDLLTKLRDEDRDYQPQGAPFSVGAYFEQAAGTHDREHLAQLQTALDHLML